MSKYICPRFSCKDRYLNKDSRTSNPAEYVCIECDGIYVIDKKGIPRLKNPMVAYKEED